MSFFSKKKKDATTASPPAQPKAAFALNGTAPHSPPSIMTAGPSSGLSASHNTMSPTQQASYAAQTQFGQPGQLQQSMPPSFQRPAQTLQNGPPNGQMPARGVLPPSAMQQPNGQPSDPSRRSNGQPTQIIYPWSQKPLHYLPISLAPPIPPELLDPSAPVHKSTLKEGISPPPFPRYGHTVNALANGNTGDLYIFGGLVADKACNDLYILHCQTNTASNANAAKERGDINIALPGSVSVALVETKGEVPSPRLGHASVGVGNVLIIWGGDTNASEDEENSEPTDDALYLLNLSTREWTRVKTAGPAPTGRYGHAAAMIGSKFYVFGGQRSNSAFLNDLWCFDLQRLKAGNAHWVQLNPDTNLSTGVMPSQRTGHTVVTTGEFLYVFGGTDGQYHYNDTWEFNSQTAKWTELQCTGYIPIPREGHSATVVDDVMYIFAGRGTDGRDLEDLAAFKITGPEGVARRWFMFQHMGPSPSGRSGHALASWSSKVFVLGGESYNPAQSNYDPNMVHILDTSKIKYPQPKNTQNRAVSGATHTAEELGRRAASPTQVVRGVPDASSRHVPSRQSQMPSTDNAQAFISDGRTSAASQSVKLVNGSVPRQKDSVDEAFRDADARQPLATGTRSISPVPPPISYPTNQTDGSVNQSADPRDSKMQAEVLDKTLSQPARARSQSGSVGASSAWLMTALAAASQKGFVLESRPNGAELPQGNLDPAQQQLREALLRLKQDFAESKAAFSDQLRSMDEQISTLQDSRTAAIREATHLKAKVAMFESAQIDGLPRLERERNAELEQRLAQALKLQKAVERENAQLKTAASLREDAHLTAVQNAKAAVDRAKGLETSHAKTLADHLDSQSRANHHEMLVVAHQDEISSLRGNLKSMTAQHALMSTQLQEAESTRQHFIATLEQTGSAMQAMQDQSMELQSQRTQARADHEAAQSRASALQIELQAKTTEVDHAYAQIDELTRLLQSAQNEQAALRNATNGSLVELLTAIKSNDKGSSDLQARHDEQMRDLSGEHDNLKMAHADAQQRVKTAYADVQTAHQTRFKIEQDVLSLRAECTALRSQCDQTIVETLQLKSELANRDAAAIEQGRSAEAAHLQAMTYKSLLIEHGIAADVPNEGSPSMQDLHNASNDQLIQRIHTLERQLEARTQSQRALETVHDETRRDLENAELNLRNASKYQQASEEQVDHIRQELERARSPAANGAVDERNPEERAAQAETDLFALQDRHKSLVESHTKAVSYVKGTEKMLRRMKEEVNKYKSRADELEAEANSRSITSPDDVSKSDLNAMRAQIADLMTFSEQSKEENGHLQKRLQTVQADFDKTLEHHQSETTTKINELEGELDRLDAALHKAQTELEDSLTLNQQLNTELAAALKRPQNTHSRENSASDPWPEAGARLQTELTAAHNRAEWLKRENERLESRCTEAENRIGLLLDHFEREAPPSESSSVDNHSRASIDGFDPARQRYSRRDSADSEELRQEFFDSRPNGKLHT